MIDLNSYYKLLIADFPYLQILTYGNLKIANHEYYHFAVEFSTFSKFTTNRLINHVHRLNKKECMDSKR